MVSAAEDKCGNCLETSTVPIIRVESSNLCEILDMNTRTIFGSIESPDCVGVLLAARPHNTRDIGKEIAMHEINVRYVDPQL